MKNPKKPEWSEKIGYLADSRYQYHNADYLEFLVRKVWKIRKQCKVVDFGCGYGYLGLELLPFFPKDTHYVGIDESPELVEKGRQLFSEFGYDATFVVSDALSSPLETGAFDVSMCHAFLMHQSDVNAAVGEMIRVTKNGGLVITCEANWNASNASQYLHGIEKSAYCDLGFLQKLFDRDRRQTGKDGNIGPRMPVLLQEAGLRNVGARMTDSCKCYLPTLSESGDPRLYKSIRAELPSAINSEMESSMVERFSRRGFTRSEAIEEVTREKLLLEAMDNPDGRPKIVMPTAMIFAFGTVEEG